MQGPSVRIRCTDDDLAALLDLRRRHPYLNDAQIIRWALHVFHRSPEPPIPLPPGPRRGRISRSARSAAMRAYLEAEDAARKEGAQ